MAQKSRYQNVVIGDTVKLELFVFNSNNPATLQSINDIKIFFLDKDVVSCTNPDGRVLIETIPGASVVSPAVGEYYIDLYLNPALYTQTGRYIDEWSVVFLPSEPSGTIDQLFQVYPELWYTSPLKIVYDFQFYFQPNRIRHGSKKFIEIEIIPNVPRATDLCAYYENLAISAQLYVFIELRCGDCVPCEQDLRLIVDRQPVQHREKNRGFYFIDTTEFDCGVYDIWFELSFGGNVYISPKNQLSIFD